MHSLTKLLVLRKIPYKESSLIISGLSPDFGKLDFMVKGAKKMSRKCFPVVDLFREIQLEFNYRKDGLQTVYSVDLVSQFDAIALNPDNFIAACKLCSFISHNSRPMMEAHELYAALKNCFQGLSGEHQNIPWCALVKLIYIYENGLLPDIGPHSNHSESEQELLAKLIEAAAGRIFPPLLGKDYWNQLAFWIEDLCRYHNLEKPD